MLLNVLSHNEKALVEQQRRRLGRDPIERLLPLSHRPLSSCFDPPSLRQNPRVERGNAFFVPRTVVVRGDPYDGWDTPPLRIDVPFSFSSGETRFHTFSRTRRWGVPLSDKERLLAQIGDMTPLFDSDRESDDSDQLLYALLRHVGRAEHHAFCFVIQGTTGITDKHQLTLVNTLESHHLILDGVEHSFEMNGLGRTLLLLDGKVLDDSIAQELQFVSVTFQDSVFEIRTYDLDLEDWDRDKYNVKGTPFRISLRKLHLVGMKRDRGDFSLDPRRLLVLESRYETLPYNPMEPEESVSRISH